MHKEGEQAFTCQKEERERRSTGLLPPKEVKLSYLKKIKGEESISERKTGGSREFFYRRGERREIIPGRK